MNAKLKGLFKGLRYISSIFEEEKEQEIVIGNPTDVKHVAHIGWEGPAATTVDSSPSWMKEFPASEGVSHSAAPTNVGGIKENSEIQYDSQEYVRKPSKPKSSGRDSPDVARSTRRQPKESSEHTHNAPRRQPRELLENSQNTDSPKKERSRNSRRRSSKEPSENGSSSNKHLHIQDLTLGPESSPARSTSDGPKKHRRRKSKESGLSGGDTAVSRSGRSSRSKGKRSGVDPGLDDRQSSINSLISSASPARSSINSVMSSASPARSPLHSAVSYASPARSVNSVNASPARTYKEDREYRPVL